MAKRHLKTVRSEFDGAVKESRRLADDAFRWALPGSVRRITRKRRDALLELAFFRVYLAWESFLEESFILHLLGARVGGKRAPHRFAFPPSETAAKEWVIPESQRYARWDATMVSSRALRFFRGGYPYTETLRSSQSVLDEARTIRNAVAHDSEKARHKFEDLLRRQKQTIPIRSTVGAFLGTTVLESIPPTSFLEVYLSRLLFLASKIVPS